MSATTSEEQQAAHVTVRCLSTLAKYQPEGGVVDIGAEETPLQLLERLGIPRKEVNLVFVNREQSEWDSTLKDGDSVGFVPLVSGG